MLLRRGTGSTVPGAAVAAAPPAQAGQGWPARAWRTTGRTSSSSAADSSAASSSARREGSRLCPHRRGWRVPLEPGGQELDCPERRSSARDSNFSASKALPPIRSTPTRCTWPRERTPGRGRATAPSCVRVIAAIPGKRPTCPSRWAATRMAGRTANGSPSIPICPAFSTSDRARTGCGRARTRAQLGQGRQLPGL